MVGWHIYTALYEGGERIANDSPYGLGGGVSAADREHGEAVARRIRVGFLIVNGAPTIFDGSFGG